MHHRRTRVQTTTQPRNRGNQGRASAKLLSAIRRDIIRGKLEPGRFLPTERDLARQFSVSRETARRALKVLESEGFTCTVPRRGHRVLSRSGGTGKGLPIAYALTAVDGRSWTGTQDSLLAAFHRAAMKQGRAMLAIGTPASPASDVLQELEATRVCGLLLDTVDPGVIELAEKTALPIVMVNDWAEDREIDSVMQDGQHGGLLAAKYFAARGRKRVAWLGRTIASSAHGFDRYSGTATGLARFGLGLAPGLEVFAGIEDVLPAARQLLSRSDRPDAVAALWREGAWSLAVAARELGLELGNDLDVVGWSVEEAYETEYVAGFRGGPVAPAITWSAGLMAETALKRLEERRADPELGTLRIKIPVRLRTEASGNAMPQL